MRSRDALVRVRVDLINHVRGAVKSFGARLPGCSTHYFHKKMRDNIPEDLRPALYPIVETIGEISNRIDRFDKLITKHCETKHPETTVLTQVHGVGALTALAFILVLEDPSRFRNSRTVGSFLGLTPRQSDSGEQEPQRPSPAPSTIVSATRPILPATTGRSQTSSGIGVQRPRNAAAC